MDEGKKKNPWEPQREQKLAPIHRLFSTDLHWGSPERLEGEGQES